MRFLRALQAKGQMNAQANGEKMLQMLGNLTAKGFDVSAITASVTSGDFKTAMTLLKEFRTAHPDAFPAHVAGADKPYLGRQRREQDNQ